jgi:hypothetical protein
MRGGEDWGQGPSLFTGGPLIGKVLRRITGLFGRSDFTLKPVKRNRTVIAAAK